jgi:hypothetical protein
MTHVEVRTFARVGTEFVPFAELAALADHPRWIPGAIMLKLGTAQVLSVDLWDDVNWLWPFLVQLLDECRRTGEGARWFPDQPIRMTAETLKGRDLIRFSVAGGTVARTGVAPATEVYRAVAEAALAYLVELERLGGRTEADDEVEVMVRSWLATG